MNKINIDILKIFNNAKIDRAYSYLKIGLLLVVLLKIIILKSKMKLLLKRYNLFDKLTKK